MIGRLYFSFDYTYPQREATNEPRTSVGTMRGESHPHKRDANGSSCEF